MTRGTVHFTTIQCILIHHHIAECRSVTLALHVTEVCADSNLAGLMVAGPDRCLRIR